MYLESKIGQWSIIPPVGAFERKLDLESIGSSLGIDWELIWAGLDWSGPDIRLGLYNRYLIIDGHRGIRRS